jgi:Flp pilus assembly secretin CpaC
MTELLRVLREITGSARIELDSHNRSITLRDSLERVELAGQVIRQVEHARGEMMLEVELLEVNRDKARQLGITPPTSAQAFLISPNDVRALSQAADLSNALTIVGHCSDAKGFSRRARVHGVWRRSLDVPFAPCREWRPTFPTL